MIAQNRYLKGERSFPVDYLRKDGDRKRAEAEQVKEKIYRRNLLKNVVMRMIIAIVERKNRPSLGEVMAVYRKKKHEPNAKEQFQEKLRKLYGD